IASRQPPAAAPQPKRLASASRANLGGRGDELGRGGALNASTRQLCRRRHRRGPPGKGSAANRAGAAQLSVPSPTARRPCSTCTQSWAVMPAAAPTKSEHAAKKESAACTRPEVALSLVVRAR